MLIKGEVLSGTITVSFTVSGKRGEWEVDHRQRRAASLRPDETVRANLVSAVFRNAHALPSRMQIAGEGFQHAERGHVMTSERCLDCNPHRILGE